MADFVGGGEVALARLVRAWNPDRDGTLVVLGPPNPELAPALGAGAEIREVRWLVRRSHTSLPRYLASVVIGNWRFLQWVRRERPTHVVLNGPSSLPYTWLARRFSRFRLVVWMHTLASSALERALLGARFWGDSVVCVSQAVAQSVGRGPGARDVVYNGVPVPSQVRGPAPRSGRLLFAGRITPGKGLAVLLEALGRVRDLPWSLSVLGRAWGVEDEQELQRLKARATALGISERVTWKGFLPLDDQWLTHDFLVFPSEWVEACPLVVLEAMAHGLVVVASGVGGVPELVQDRRTGYLVPPSDPEALAAQLRRVLVGEGTELETTAAAARQTVGRDFALPTQVERLKAAFFSGVA